MDLKPLTITPELLRLITEIDEFKGSWRVQSAQSPECLQALRHVSTIESIGSSTRIEGSKLSDSAIEALLSNVDQTSFLTRTNRKSLDTPKLWKPCLKITHKFQSRKIILSSFIQPL